MLGFPFKLFSEKFGDYNYKLTYIFEKNTEIIMNIFKVVDNDMAHEYGIKEFELNQTTLEDVLNNVITKSFIKNEK